MKDLLFLKKYISKYRYRFLLGIVFVGLSNWFKVLQPQVIREALDTVVAQVQMYKDTGGIAAHPEAFDELGAQIIKFAGTVIVLAFIMGFFMYWMRQTIIVMSRLIEYDMRKELYGHLSKMDTAYFKRSKTGDLMSRLSEDVSKVRMFVGPAILYGINLTFLFSMTISAMVAVSPTLTFWTLLPLPILSISIYYVSRIINQRSTKIQEQLSTLTSTAQEVYSGIRVVKSYAQEDAMVEWFRQQSQEFRNRSMSLVQVNSFFHPLMLLLIGASTIITVYVGGLQVIAGTVTTGNIAEFVIYVNMLTWPVAALGWITSLTQQAAASQKRINKVLSEQALITSPANAYTPENGLNGHISFQNVSFIYPDTGIQALKDVSFTIKPGEKVALVGRTGTGKTSIADLLVRLYDPTEGTISLDKRNLKEYDLDALRDSVGYVPQDVFLFSDTVHQNIAFGNPDVSEAEAKQWAERAAIHEEILGLSDGYQTMVGERGVTLSGGQKQRISIARVLAKKPSLLILDDCLSAVDANTENKINTYLSEELADKTALIITHRIHGSIPYDRILVLEDGHIAQEGTHEELMLQEGYYQELIERQMAEEV